MNELWEHLLVYSSECPRARASLSRSKPLAALAKESPWMPIWVPPFREREEKLDSQEIKGLQDVQGSRVKR